MRLKLIANPVAGRRAAEMISRAADRLRERGASVDLTLTGARGDARAAAGEARTADFDRVLAAGGDGTLNEVINGLAPSPIPLAFLPLGTANVFALEVGLPSSVEAACDLAIEGEATPVSLGVAGETRFLLMAGVGYDAEVVYGLNLRLKRRIGKLAYVVGGLAAWATRPQPPLEVVAEDGTVHRGFGAVIGNARLYAGTFSMTPEASLLRDRLDLCLLQRPGRLNLLRLAYGVAAGRPPAPPLARCLRGRRFTVRGERVPVQIDGDYLGRLPMTFHTVFGELSLVLPPGFAEKEER